jgi:hypothetical protein
MTDIKPISTWDSDAAVVEFVAWRSRLDDRYLVEVQYAEDNSYQGTLAIFDHLNGDRLVHSEPTGIAYGARFGPDIDDVATWHERAAEVVDNLGATTP